MALDTAAAPVSQRWLAESLGLNRTTAGGWWTSSSATA